MEFSTQIDRTFVSEWKALKKEDEDAAAEDGILGPGKPAEELIARP